MATPRPRPRPGRALATMAIALVALLGTILAGMRWSDASATPALALDLEGGTQLILTPRTTDGSQVTQEDITEAIGIIRQRVDASGVSEAEITSQGQENIVVALPGQPSQETLDLVRTSAQLRFRPVLTYTQPGPLDVGAMQQQLEQQGADPAAEPPPTPAPLSPEENAAAAVGAADLDGDGQLSTEPATEPTSNSDPVWLTEQLTHDFYLLDCTAPENLVGGGGDDPAQPTVACAPDGSVKYALGPVDIEGTQISSASSGMGVNAQGQQTGQWVVNLQFDNDGTDEFREVSERLVAQQPPQNQFAITLDGLVVSAPTMQSVIADGRAQISGSFTSESAAALANQLNFGSLPLDFEVQSEQQISATLGAEQLERGLLAGLIGLVLVVLYLGVTYRGLSIVSLSSLAVAAVATYLVITLLSWTMGYRLSLPGVVGLIVAVGITADSFIVYFERIRDELREGRTIHAAVEQGWHRARRTILASDAVNLLAAAVLYFLSVGGVRGFAFTLGLTTIIDVVVVFLFTHPLMQLLARTRFFGEGRRGSGLEPATLGISASSYGVGRERAAGRAVRAVRPSRAETTGDAVESTGTGRTPDTGADLRPSGESLDATERAELATTAAGNEARATGTGGKKRRRGRTIAEETAEPVTGSEGRPTSIAERRRAERLAAGGGTDAATAGTENPEGER